MGQEGFLRLDIIMKFQHDPCIIFQDALIIDLSDQLWNQTNGLCGSNNGNPWDDFKDSSGEFKGSVPDLTQAWELWSGLILQV